MTREVRIGVGIIGAGFARSTQVPAFRACPGVDVLSLASAHRDKAAAVAGEFAIPHATDDWRDVLAHPGVDLVCISTPPALREGMTFVEGAATFEDGWRNQLVLDAARRSHEERRWVVP